MTSYSAAIHRTNEALEARARNFRHQVVTLLVLGLVPVVLAVVARSPVPLVWLVLLVPGCGSFLWVDHVAVERWRSEILAAWAMGELDVSAFCRAIRANPAHPTDTIEGMLVTLPSAGDLAAEQRLSSATRRAIAAATSADGRVRSDVMALKIAASLIVAGVLVAAVTMHRREPLAALASLVLLPAARLELRHRQRAECHRAVRGYRTQAGFSEGDYARALAVLSRPRNAVTETL